MLATAHPENAMRLEKLWELDVLDSGPEKVYDDLTRLTADICDTPYCLISLVDKDRQWFKSKCGFQIDETPIEYSVCSHAVAEESFLEIPDTHLDDRTKDNPLCHGENAIRFYAGALLKTFDGWPLGTLCVLDAKPRALNELQRQTLRVHAKNVSRQIELTKVLIGEMSKTLDGRSTTNLAENEFLNRVKKLTPREREIHQLILDGSHGSSSKKIGRELGISPRTVDHHRANIMSKLDVESVAELISRSLKAA